MRSLVLILLLGGWTTATAEDLAVVATEDFEQGADRWEPTDSNAWKVKKTRTGMVYSQFKKRSDYQPPYRSPLNISLLKGVQVTDFVLDVRVQSTHEDYDHRDVCLFFGFQDPSHFYYVHLGKKADEHANQIFIVNGAARTKISTTSTEGTNWNDEWHHIRIARDTESGSIRVYYDDLESPVMTATDKHFTWGQIGLGSFDDTGNWDDLELRGKLR